MLKNIDHNNVIHYGKDTVIVLARKDEYSGSTCLKILNEEFPSKEQLSHLENEFHFGTAINLACSRKVIEKKVIGNHQAIVFEYVEGMNLHKFLDTKQPDLMQKMNLGIELA